MAGANTPTRPAIPYMANNKTAPKRKTVIAELGAIHQWMKDHEKADDGRFDAGTKHMDLLATKTDIAELAKMFMELDEHGDIKRDATTGMPIVKFATKKDVLPVVKFYDKLALSAQIVNGGSKWFSSAVFWLAAFLLAASVITGKIWFILGGLAHWMSSLNK